MNANCVLMPGHHVDAIAHVGDRGRNRARPRHQQVGTTVRERLLAQPHHVGGKAIGGLQLIITCEHIASGHVDLVIQGERDRLTSHCKQDITVVGNDAIDLGGATRVGDNDVITGPYCAGHHGACVAAEVSLGSNDVLHGKAEGALNRIDAGLPLRQGLQQVRTVIPGH